MMAVPPITDPIEAKMLLISVLRPEERPVLAADEVNRLVERAASDDGSGGTVYTVRDLNRSASLGCQWKASAAAAQFEAGVGAGKTFKLNQVYDHWMQLAGLYASGAMSVVGSATVDDGAGAPGGRARIGSVGMTSVMNEAR